MPLVLLLVVLVVGLELAMKQKLHLATSAQVRAWIDQAVAILTSQGVDPALMNPDDVAAVIHYESAGDPAAINLEDRNFLDGHPSQGLMQVIPSVFAQYALPGFDREITDPVSNIIAGIRYAIAVYGSVAQVPGLVAVSQGRKYVGY